MEQNEQIVYKHKLATLFAELSNFVENKAFPNYRKELIKEDDVSGRKWVYKTSYNLTHPLTAKEINSPFFFLLWFFISVFQYFYFAFGLVFIYHTLSDSWSFTPQNRVFNIILLSLFFLFGIISNTVCYIWWIRKLKSAFYKWWMKVLIIVFALVFTLSITFFSLQRIIGLYDLPVNFLFASIAISSLITIFSIFPSLSYFLAIIVDIFISLFLLFRAIIGNFISFIDPRKTQLIDQILDEDIPSNREKSMPWKINSLSKDEINSLHQWAIANQESSEKRTIPAFLLIALFGILSTSKPVQNIFDIIINYFIDSCKSFLDPLYLSTFSLNSILSNVFVFTIILITLFFFRYLFSLFKNIVTQSINIEICVLAKHEIIIQEDKKSFWEKLLN